MKITPTNFQFKKGIFDNKSNLVFLTIIAIPIFLFRNGVLDLSFVSVFFTLYGVLLYFSISNIFEIKILDNSTEFKNVFGKKTIIPNQKISYSETYLMREKGIINSDKQTLKLKIKFLNNNVTLYKDEDLNYDEIIQYCKKNYNRSYDESINYFNYIIPSIIICIGIYLFVFTKNCFEKQTEDNLREIQKNGYVKISGTYRNYETIGKGNTEIWFHLYEYPKFDFSPIEFAKDKSKYYNLKSKGEKVTILISPNEYKKKIEKSIPLKFYDRYFRYNEVVAYRIE